MILKTDEQPEKDGLDNADRLALHILGCLALKAWFVFDAMVSEPELYEKISHDIADAIRSGLPHMDSVAIERMMQVSE